MKKLFATALLGTSFVAAPPARADLLNNAAIDAHVDEVLARAPVSTLDPRARQALVADRLTLNLGVLVPVFGSYRLDTEVYGNVRPSAILFDWILGGFVPAGLAVTALAAGHAIGPRPQADLVWTALALYGSTRAAILVIGNMHITEYNTRIKVGLELSGVPGGGAGLTAVGRW